VLHQRSPKNVFRARASSAMQYGREVRREPMQPIERGLKSQRVRRFRRWLRRS
jgi:hypothetical protein